jgi:hypothetical protein
MRAGKSLSVSSADIRRLKALVQDRNMPQKHVWRDEIVLLTADGVGTNEIMRRTRKSKDLRLARKISPSAFSVVATGYGRMLRVIFGGDGAVLNVKRYASSIAC